MALNKLLVIYVMSCWIAMISSQNVHNVDKANASGCNETSCDNTAESRIDKSAPPGFNDKTHYGDKNNSLHRPYRDNGGYALVPPFLIGASTVIVTYIIGHCIYLHCYATRKMRRLAERQYPPAIVISDDPTSTASYKTFTPILQYNEQGELVDGQQFLFYQPFDDDEWERQMSLRRNSSIRSSRRSSRSSRRSSTKSTVSRKTSFSLQIPKFFSKRRSSDWSSMADNQQENPDNQGSPKHPQVCLLPLSRSLSVPGKADRSNTSPSKGYLFSPVVLARTQSCKSPSSRKSIVPTPKINGSSSAGDLKPPESLTLPQIVIIGAGDQDVVHNSTTEGATSDAASDLTPSASTSSQPECSAKAKTKPAQKDKRTTQVLFHLGEAGAEEAAEGLCDIKEEHE